MARKKLIAADTLKPSPSRKVSAIQSSSTDPYEAISHHAVIRPVAPMASRNSSRFLSDFSNGVTHCVVKLHLLLEFKNECMLPPPPACQPLNQKIFKKLSARRRSEPGLSAMRLYLQGIRACGPDAARQGRGGRNLRRLNGLMRKRWGW